MIRRVERIRGNWVPSKNTVIFQVNDTPAYINVGNVKPVVWGYWKGSERAWKASVGKSRAIWKEENEWQTGGVSFYFFFFFFTAAKKTGINGDRWGKGEESRGDMRKWRIDEELWGWIEIGCKIMVMILMVICNGKENKGSTMSRKE